MKSFYYQFVNFIQTMSPLWFTTIFLLMSALILVFIMKFFKIYNGTQKKFEKISYIIVAVLLLVVLIYLTYLR